MSEFTRVQCKQTTAAILSLAVAWLTTAPGTAQEKLAPGEANSDRCA